MNKRVWAGCQLDGVVLVVSDGRLVIPEGKTFSVECAPEHRGMLARALGEMAMQLMQVPEANTPHSDGLCPSVDWVDDGAWYDRSITRDAVPDTEPAPPLKSSPRLKEPS